MPQIEPERTILYPTTDPKPAAESDLHFRQRLDLFFMLDAHFEAALDVYVGGYITLYYIEGEADVTLVPDVLIARNVVKRPRWSYRVWEEGKAPDVIIQVADIERKYDTLSWIPELCAEVGIQEYFVFDPMAEAHEPPLCGFQLRDGAYIRTTAANLYSEALALELRAENGQLRLFDPRTSSYLLTPSELKKELERLRREQNT